MARRAAVLLAVFMAVIGLASAAVPESTIAAVSPSGLAEAPDSTIGAIDEGNAPSSNDNVQAGSIGGPVPAGTFAPGAPAPSPSNSGAPVLEGSMVAGVVTAVAGYFFF